MEAAFSNAKALYKPNKPHNFKQEVKGYNWDKNFDYTDLLDSYTTTGFQATNFGKAVDQINKMIDCRQQPIPDGKLIQDEGMFKEDPFIKIKNNCTVYLGYTSNMVSSGVRETIKFLVKNKMVDCIVTTTGGIEEDFMKCMAPTYIKDSNVDDKNLFSNGLNRIFNLVVPNNNYIKFKDWILPIFEEMLKEQIENGVIWSPSKMVTKLGLKINDEDSIYYWAAKNEIPVFCPSITDGSIGDVLFFYNFNKKDQLILDIVTDINRINCLSIKSINTGLIVVGGGLIKHHILNTNAMRCGANFAVYLNTASEFDGSDSGAPPSEAFSWGKINTDATAVKIHAEATLVFPLLVAKTFGEKYLKNKCYINN